MRLIVSSLARRAGFLPAHLLVAALLLQLGAASQAFAQDSVADPADRALQALEEADAPRAKSGGTPHLIVPNPMFDFGEVDEGIKVTHAFIVNNKGTGALEIQRMYPGCGCTVASSSSAPIPPGGEGTISVTFDTAGFQGKKVKTVRVYSNDTDHPAAVLTVQGIVKNEFQIQPMRLNFGQIAKGDVKSLQATVLVDSKTDIKFSEVATRSDQVELTSEDVEREGKPGKLIKVTLKPTVPIGIFRERITIKTTSEKNPVVLIPIFARVNGDLKLVPSDVSFGLVKGPLEKPVSRTVKLINVGSSPLKVLSVVSDTPGVSATLKPSSRPNEFEVEVTLETGSSGTLKARVKLLTDHPDKDQQELTLPVYGIISRRNG